MKPKLHQISKTRINSVTKHTWGIQDYPNMKQGEVIQTVWNPFPPFRITIEEYEEPLPAVAAPQTWT